jgi:hypothetical protein
VVGQPYKSFSLFQTKVDVCTAYERDRDMNVIMNHKFLSLLGLNKMRELLPPDRPSKKGTDETRIQDLNPKYDPSHEQHEPDPETCQQEVSVVTSLLLLIFSVFLCILSNHITDSIVQSYH